MRLLRVERGPRGAAPRFRKHAAVQPAARRPPQERVAHGARPARSQRVAARLCQRDTTPTFKKLLARLAVVSLCVFLYLKGHGVIVLSWAPHMQTGATASSARVSARSIALKTGHAVSGAAGTCRYSGPIDDGYRTFEELGWVAPDWRERFPEDARGQVPVGAAEGDTLTLHAMFSYTCALHFVGDQPCLCTCGCDDAPQSISKHPVTLMCYAL